MDNFIVSFSLIVSLIVGLVQVAKTYINKRYLPLLALILGVGLIFLRDNQILNQVWSEDIFLGLIAGLSAMGLWSGGKTLTGR